MDNNRRLSRFMHVIRLSPDVVALWNSMWLRVIYITNPLATYVESWLGGDTLQDLLCKIPEDIQPEFEQITELLENEKFLVNEGDDESQLLEVRGTIKNLPIAILYLILSGSCNLACPGCFIGKVVHGENKGLFGKTMSKETIKNALDNFKGITEKSGVVAPEIVLYGGEPLLNRNGLEFAITYAKSILPDCTFTLNTNATLITQEIAQLLAQYDVGVAVSINGPRSIHDETRPDPLGNGSFDSTVAGFKILQKFGVRVSVSCTMLPENVATIVDTVSWLISELGVVSLDLNMYLGTFQDETALSSYAENASDALIRSFVITRQSGVHLDRVIRKLDPLIEGRLTFNGCGACGQQIVITPDGSMGACHAGLNEGDDFIRVKGDFFDPTNHHIWNKWRERSPFNIQECLGCESLGICGGGCPYNAKLSSGNFMELDKAHCTFSKAVLKFFLQELLVETSKQE